jgi:hypothetical protein
MARKTARPKTVPQDHQGEVMAQDLVAIHHPDNFDPSKVTEAMVRDIDVPNEEMEAAGARFFAGGLEAPPQFALRAFPSRGQDEFGRHGSSE